MFCPSLVMINNNRNIPNGAFRALLGILWDSWSEAEPLFFLGGLVWGTVFTLSVISAVGWMCSLDKCFPWWGPYLTTNRLSPETDDDLKLPLFLTPLYFGLTAGHYAFALWMLATFCGSQLLNQVSFSASVNESQRGWKWVWIPSGIIARNVFQI